MLAAEGVKQIAVRLRAQRLSAELTLSVHITFSLTNTNCYLSISQQPDFNFYIGGGVAQLVRAQSL